MKIIIIGGKYIFKKISCANTSIWDVKVTDHINMSADSLKQYINLKKVKNILRKLIKTVDISYCHDYNTGYNLFQANLRQPWVMILYWLLYILYKMFDILWELKYTSEHS